MATTVPNSLDNAIAALRYAQEAFRCAEFIAGASAMATETATYLSKSSDYTDLKFILAKSKAAAQVVATTKSANEAVNAAKAATKAIEAAGLEGAVYDAFKAVAHAVSEAIETTGLEDAVYDALNAAARAVSKAESTAAALAVSKAESTAERA